MTSTTPAPRVLLVDDEPSILVAFARELRRRGNEVTTADDGEAALRHLGSGTFDVIVSDINMPGLDGIELLRRVRQHDLDVPVILMTGAPSIETATRALEQGALRYLFKPVQSDELVVSVERAHRLHELARLKREALRLLGRTDQQLGDRSALDVRFRSALDQVHVVYQPIVSWSGRRIVAREALARTGETTLADPASLVSAAERTGRIHELGRVIRTRIARDLAESEPDADVFVNLHSSDLEDESLYGHGVLSPFAPRIVLEITERATLETVSDVRGRVERLRALGYRIALDDLGAGYAGLSSLAQLQPDLVKLDMSITRNIDGDGTKRRLVSSMVALCHELGTSFVVEGVETSDELATLLDLGADLFQGFLFARPAAGFGGVRWPLFPAGAGEGRSSGGVSGG